MSDQPEPTFKQVFDVISIAFYPFGEKLEPIIQQNVQAYLPIYNELFQLYLAERVSFEDHHVGFIFWLQQNTRMAHYRWAADRIQDQLDILRREIEASEGAEWLGSKK